MYKIFAYQFVLGNKINQKYDASGTPDTSFKIQIENLPEANLVEVELISTKKRVADTPPLSPEVLFVPYFGVDNKIGLFLNGRTGLAKIPKNPKTASNKGFRGYFSQHKTLQTGLEPVTDRLEGGCSILLSYWSTT